MARDLCSQGKCACPALAELAAQHMVAQRMLLRLDWPGTLHKKLLCFSFSRCIWACPGEQAHLSSVRSHNKALLPKGNRLGGLIRAP